METKSDDELGIFASDDDDLDTFVEDDFDIIPEDTFEDFLEALKKANAIESHIDRLDTLNKLFHL